MSEASSRTKLLLGILVLVLVTVLWFLFVFSPRRDAIAAAQAEQDGAALRQITLQTALDNLQQIKENELTYLFAIGQMEASIPTTPQADAFIEDLTFLAESTGVELSTISLTPPVADPLTGGFEVPVSISIDGEYFEILGFLYGVEALDRLVIVDAVSLTPTQGPDLPETTEPPEGDDDGVVTDPRITPDTDILAADITMRIFARTPATETSGEVSVPQGSAELDEESSGDDI